MKLCVEITFVRLLAVVGVQGQGDAKSSKGIDMTLSCLGLCVSSPDATPRSWASAAAVPEEKAALHIPAALIYKKNFFLNRIKKKLSF